MPKPFPPEFRREVIAVARRGESTLTPISRDFGISPSCLHRAARLAIITWIERTYHRRRRQRRLGKMTPIEYEAVHAVTGNLNHPPRESIKAGRDPTGRRGSLRGCTHG